MEPMSMMALASLIGSAGGVGGSLFSANQQQGYQQQQLQQAQQNYILQKQIAEQQQRMAEAGRTDSAGNQVYFNGKDWVSKPTEATKGIISASQLNERENQVKGGTRREISQENNFRDRGNAANESNAVLRMLRDRVGAPTEEGVRGRGAIAGATEAGANRDTLVDTVARNLIRSGAGGPASDRAIAGIDDNGARSLRTTLAKNDASTPEQFRVANEGWETGRLNKFNPLAATASNLTDAPFSPTQIGAPIDASLNQAATYGAGTSGRGASGLNAAASLQNFTPTPMPWGPAAGALTDSVMAYMRARGRGGSNNGDILNASKSAYSSGGF